MKKILLIILMLAAATLSFGQLNTNRNLATKVSDAVVLLPARDAATLDHVMGELVATGAEGMETLTAMFTDVNNVPVNYALNGLAFYVMDEGRQAARKTFEEGIVSALGKAADIDVKRFYLTLISHVGTDYSVPVLGALISDTEYFDAGLADYALHALGSINSDAARYAVEKALTDGPADKAALAGAAAYMRIDGVYPLLNALLADADEAQKPSILDAMARTGDTRALLYFSPKAASDKYAPTENTLLYLEALKNYAVSNPANGSKRAKDLMANAKKAGNKNLMLNAFGIYASAGGADLTKMVVSAMDDPSRQYRKGVLQTVSPYADNEMCDKLLAKADKTKNNEVKADIIYFVAGNSPGNIPGIAGYINNPDDEVAVEAVNAFYNNREHRIIPELLLVISSGRSGEVIKAAKEYIIACSDEEVRQAAGDGILDRVYESANPYGRAAVIEIIGAKQLRDYMPLVTASLNDSDKDISEAAYAALPGISGEKELPFLFELLDKAGEDKLKFVQQAILSASYDMPAEERMKLFKANMDAAHGSPAYFSLLASTGDPAAFQLLEDAYPGENPAGKDQVIKALSLGNKLAAAGHLYNIALGYGSQPALRAYIAAVAAADMKPERKYTMFLKASELATDKAAKASLVTETGKLPVFQALILAGEYLGDSDARVRDLAAQAVMNIAMTNPDWNGQAVKELLTKARGALNNPDAEYNRKAIDTHLAELEAGDGFVSIFNGQDLTGWKGIVDNPVARAKMNAKDLAKKQEAADALMRQNWTVENGALVYIGDGYDNIATVKDYGDIEMYIDWRLYPEDKNGDGGIYLRGAPQVQIWDTSRVEEGAEVGSGGLYNNEKGGNNPLVYADNPIGDWNTFRILMKGDRVTVWLNGELVVNNVILENFWDRSQPIFPSGQIELQGHTTRIAHKNIYVKELPMAEPYKVSDEERAEGFVELFDGVSIDKWYGNTRDYVAEDGNIVMYPSHWHGGNLYTKEEFGDFVLRFEFWLTPGANNGIGIRTPDEGDAAFVGMEIQVLDDTDPVYANLKEYQYHGSVYGVIAAKRGHLRPVGEWNVQEIYAQGNHIRVTLNGVVIVDGDLAEATKNGIIDGRDHPGLFNKSGHIAFLGHGSHVKFRNLRIKRLD